jgi:hypothetical protein
MDLQADGISTLYIANAPGDVRIEGDLGADGSGSRTRVQLFLGKVL